MAIHFLFADEYLEIDGIELATYAWWVESLAPLFTIHKRGANETLPYVAGTVAYQRRTTSTTVSLRLAVVGDVDEDGDPTDNPRAALYTHLDYLQTGLLADIEGTRTALWYRPDGSVWAAEVHVEGFTVVGTSPESANCTLELMIPAGTFEPVES